MKQSNDSHVVLERRCDIDWLRVLAVLALFPFHTGRIFNHEDFYVKNAVLSTGTDIFLSFVNQWHMPLFFFVSGVGAWFALSHRTARQYVSDRFKRLMVPLLFGMLVVIPPQLYYMRLGGLAYNHLERYQIQSSYLEYYPRSFKGIVPSGEFEWGRLWFLPYLFTFSLVALPLFRFIREDAGKKLISKLAAVCEKRGGTFLPIIPLIVIEVALRPKWPGFQNLINDWASFFYYLTFFIYGYILSSEARFREAIDRHGRTALLVGISCVVLYLGLDSAELIPSLGYTPASALIEVLRCINAWSWLVAILAFGQWRLNFSNTQPLTERLVR